MKKILALILCSVLPATVMALRLEAYEKYKGTEQVSFYITGVGNGYLWTNIMLEQRGDKPLYCQLGKLVLNEKNYTKILDKAIEDFTGVKPDSPVELLLLDGLQKTFPCDS